MSHKIVYEGRTFSADKIKGGNLYLAASLLASALEVNSFLPVVECDDPAILDFQRNAKLLYYAEPDRPMVFRVQNIKRVGPNLYEISATSTLGLLTEGLHYGGIYTGQTAEAVIASICGSIPFTVKSNIAGIELYGWLPIAAPRDNLAQVLFAIGATIRNDLDGVLRIEILWDGIAGQVPADRMYAEASADYSGKITKAVVLEHKYSPGTEEKKLFEGTAQYGDIITFSEPVHSLQASGFSILESGANYAKVSSGAGELRGKAYMHSTLQISRDVWPAQYPNVKTVVDATLVSVTNSYDVAKRLSVYYKCLERIDAPVVYHGETPGDRLAAYHPFDKVGVDACLESADINLSNTLKAKEKSLVGYIPPQYEKMILFDRRVFLTGSGTWTVPEGVSDIRVVVIGGGTSGTDGTSGGSASVTTKYYDNPGASLTTTSSSAGSAGTGGKAGTPGKVYETNIQVSPGQQISYSAGGLGQNSVFGSVSSASGGIVPGGWMDTITREWFAKPGVDGVSGASGGSPGSNGGSVGGHSGGYGLRGTSGKAYSSSREAYVSYTTNGIGGGGASASGNGGSPSGNPYVGISWNGYSYVVDITLGGYPSPGAGGSNGASAATYGGAGSGGNGGGGAGAIGSVSINVTIPAGDKLSRVNWKGALNPGGGGGSGGSGRAGCIILYFGQAEKVPSGQLVDKNNKMVLDRLGRRVIV